MREKQNIKVYETKEEKQHAAGMALKHRLYVSGWVLSGELVKIRKDPEYAHNIALYYKENKPIGIVITTCENMLQVFVRKNERKRGIGSELIKEVKTERSWDSVGLDRTGKIWKHNKVLIK
ncbi:hypothetical protein [Aeromonas phage 4L372D]|uniref:Uncharacterized protein n=1 Tax=Aeromonas phage 4L372D TaxID=2588518 RepID=A0A5B9N3B6_9CAUD|nr:hypothetical protein HWC27_gp238 [Aeromonas phage 4L372D]QEG08617.1 hypothetical protein [Aeromonas phage 4L372D]